jgi:2-polyprenyl-3-methyl-5-hydroxy-6-metoxy-1,4-benzoquinol methylase
MTNQELKSTYDEMHEKGPEAWFGDGVQEAKTILDIGKPWHHNNVLEIGCGEGNLAYNMALLNRTGFVWAIDYSETAILKAVEKYEGMELLHFGVKDYKDLVHEIKYNRIVMQGVLEHLDEPFVELKWMIDNLLAKDGDIITSSPAFLNPRGYIWMTLNMLGAVMSKTDLHYLNVWDFQAFCKKHHYYLVNNRGTDRDWGNGQRMLDDLRERIPLALQDGEIKYGKRNFNRFMKWLKKTVEYTEDLRFPGATMVYRIQT